MTKEEMLRNIAAEIEKYETRFGLSCLERHSYNGEKFVEVKDE
jgi:hypothetical protein